MFKSYNVNGKNITIHYKMRIKGISNLISAYYLGISSKIHKKIHTIRLNLVKKYRELKYRKISIMLETINKKRRTIVCGGFLCIKCPDYMTCSFW